MRSIAILLRIGLMRLNKQANKAHDLAYGRSEDDMRQSNKWVRGRNR